MVPVAEASVDLLGTVVRVVSVAAAEVSEALLSVSVVLGAEVSVSVAVLSLSSPVLVAVEVLLLPVSLSVSVAELLSPVAVDLESESSPPLPPELWLMEKWSEYCQMELSFSLIN